MNEAVVTDVATPQMGSEKNVASIAKSGGAIKDNQGRTRYIVELVDDPAGKPSKFNDTDSAIKWHQDNSAKLIGEVIKLRGVDLVATTSLIGVSFTAYLTEKQVDQFSKDKRVLQATPDATLRPSGTLWNNTNESPYWWMQGQQRSWGLQAMGIGAGAGGSNGNATVYVLDLGVELHSDLPGLSAANQLSAMPGISLVDCYPHASHVAGIIGAGDNGFGTVGALPGARLVSIAIADTSEPGTCAKYPSAAAMIQGLEIVYRRVFAERKVGVVNISFNSPGAFSSGGTLGRMMAFVATPHSYYSPGYLGALIVQSAGNQNENSCAHAYDGAAAGVLVVGGLDENGQRVRPLAGAKNAYLSLPTAGDGPGSNFGNCVSVWAPSQRIKSTWSNNGYAVISGTSMAAPHVAGFAARLLEASPAIQTSHDLAAAVRARAVPLMGSNLPMPHWLSQSQSAAPTLEISDGGTLQASAQPINFLSPNGRFPDELANFRFEAEGAASCQVTHGSNAGTYTQFISASSPNYLGGDVSPGFNSWSVTCSSPFGVQNTVQAYGTVKRRVTRVQWFARTTSTFGQWQAMRLGYAGASGFDTVYWSASANAPFDQYFESEGADYCNIKSSGMRLGPLGTNRTDFFLLWDSGNFFPTSYTFSTMYLGNPETAPWPLGPYFGYQWLLTCTNSDGDSNTTEMQGRAGF